MYLGIDLGTSEVKALVIDENNGVVATHSAPLTIQRPKPHWSEQSPEAWWEATEYLIATLREKCGHHWQAIKAIGLSGQMHGAVLLDAAGEPLRPAILWNDTRCAQECAELEEMAPELHQVAGNLAMPGFTAPKLLWVRRHEPQNFSRLATVLLPKDYLRFKMTGKKISDMSDSAGTLWLDVGKRDWSDALLEKCGLSRAAMPALVEGCEVSALLEPAVAQRWGLNPSVIVAGGGGDNAVRRDRGWGRFAGRCVYFAGHLRRAVCGHRCLPSGAPVCRARVLSRAAKPVASDERDVKRRQLSTVVLPSGGRHGAGIA